MASDGEAGGGNAHAGVGAVVLRLPPSVNHSYRRVWRGRPGSVGGYMAQQLTPEAEAWLDECRLRAGMAARASGWRAPGPGTKVVVELFAYWPDARRRDVHNLHKLVADGLEGVVYTDDRWALLRDMDFAIDRSRPRLEVRWYRR